MNLRVIKKDIEYFIGEFIDDCSLFVSLNPGCDTTGINTIINEAVDLYNELRDKITLLPEELKKPKRTAAQRRDKATVSIENAARARKLAAYYGGIRTELIDRLDTLSEKLSGVISKEVEEAKAE